MKKKNIFLLSIFFLLTAILFSCPHSPSKPVLPSNVGIVANPIYDENNKIADDELTIFLVQQDGCPVYYKIVYSGENEDEKSFLRYDSQNGIVFSDDALIIAYAQDKKGNRSAETRAEYVFSEKASSPVIEPAEFTFTTQSCTITLTCPDSDVEIFYTLDGQDVKQYTQPFAIKKDSTIIAYSTSENKRKSSRVRRDYKRYIAPPVFQEDEFINKGKKYFISQDENSGQNVNLSSSASDGLIYYTLDGSTPTASSSVWTQELLLTSSCTLSACVIVDGCQPSEVVSCLYKKREKNTITPTFNLRGDYIHDSAKFSSSFEVNINSPRTAKNLDTPLVYYYINDDSQHPQLYTSAFTISDKPELIQHDENGDYIALTSYITSLDTYLYDVSKVKIYRMKETLTPPEFLKSNTDYFYGNFPIEISSSTQDAEIYCRTNPQSPFVLYDPSNPISINSTSTIQAYCQTNTSYSPLADITYTKDTLLDNKSPTRLASGIYRYDSIYYSDYSGSDGSTRFNLYLPRPAEEITEEKPFVVYVHGGSWNSGDPDEYERYFEFGSEKYAESYVQKYGIPVISIDYRHIGSGGGKLSAYTYYHTRFLIEYDIPFAGTVTVFDKTIDGTETTTLDYYCFKNNGNKIKDSAADIETCFKFIHKHAHALRVKRDFAIMDGYSAGGNLELLYALNNEYEKPIPIKALIDRVGPADMSNYEYVRFFSDILTHGKFASELYYMSGSTYSKRIDLDMIPGNNDGEYFLEGMIKTATDLNCTFSEIKNIASNGLDNAPDEIKHISPANFALPNGRTLPYIVMAYGNDVSMDISLEGYAVGGYKAVATLDGDPLAPRKGGELLARRLDTDSKILSYDSSGRIAKNRGQTAYYHGDYSKNQMFTFIGSGCGGHDVSSTGDPQFLKHWSVEELSLLRQNVAYALEEVCRIKPI